MNNPEASNCGYFQNCDSCGFPACYEDLGAKTIPTVIGALKVANFRTSNGTINVMQAEDAMGITARNIRRYAQKLNTLESEYSHITPLPLTYEPLKDKR